METNKFISIPITFPTGNTINTIINTSHIVGITIEYLSLSNGRDLEISEKTYNKLKEELL